MAALTFGAMRTRLATFYSLDETDAQVLAVLNECIQTGYEKVISMANMHSKEKDLSTTSILSQSEYTVAGLGIPTYVGYLSTRLVYLPYDVLREKYNNFGTNWDSGSDDPVYYSLKGFNSSAEKTLVIAPAPKAAGNTIYIMCFQNPPALSLTTDFPLVPQEWQWLVLERAKIERLRFMRDNEAYVTQAQEFVAYVKVMMNRIFPATPEPESGFKIDPGMANYNAWRISR